MLAFRLTLGTVIRLIAAAISVIVAMSLPLGYWSLSYEFEAADTQSDANVHGALLTQRINANPSMWRYEVARLDAVLAADMTPSALPERRDILDAQGGLIAQSGDVLDAPILSRSVDLMDSGQVVGQLVISRSMLPLALRTVIVWLFSVSLALGIYSTLSLLPLRALQRATGDLQREQERYRGLVESLPVGLLVCQDGVVVFANPAVCALLGAARAEDLTRRPLLGLVHPQSQPSVREDMQAFGEGSPVARAPQEARFKRLDDQIIDVQIQTTTISYLDAAALQLTVVDITERKKSESDLRLAASVFSHAREGISISDALGNILQVNDTFTDITGYSREEALGQNSRMLKSGRHGPEFYAAMWHDVSVRGYWSGEIWNRRKNGELFVEMLTVSAVHDANGAISNYVALFSDITALKEHQHQLEQMAHFDTLTGLPNRLLLSDRLQQAMLQSQRRKNLLAVVCFDLDGFKAVNDAYGHDVGDKLLLELSQRMKDVLRESDTLARPGGDEFIAILVDLTQFHDSEPQLKRLLQAAASPVSVNTEAGPVVIQISASAGVTLYPQDNVDADLLMRHADQALYSAKQAGKNRYQLFDVARDAAMSVQRENLERIRSALDNNEFVLYYQPKVNLRTGEVVGAEALIRWQHPVRGMVPPADFLPVIENHPLSVQIGEWVIRTALRQIRAWSAQLPEVIVSVNLSAYQLQQDGFAERLRELLGEYADLNPERLQLEVLETSDVEDLEAVSAVMKACVALGVSFALDDFGTGYSSLTYLKHLPAESLKIDQSFVRNMLHHANDLAIVKSVVGLAEAFGRQVVAEGVETQVHGQALLSMGCELAQGYGIARPMPAADFPGWAANWRVKAVWTA
jgi:diguanylate cyclase (GGDEF)-like protein/PAS domain S-box-containing protein